MPWAEAVPVWRRRSALWGYSQLVQDPTDAADRLTAISDAPTASPSTPFASFTYGRDAANQVSSVTSTGVPADTNSYSYNQLNQLKGVGGGSYGYDAADNPVQLASGAVQAFDPANQLTASSTIWLVGTSSAGDAATTSSLTVNLPTSTVTNDQILLSTTLPNSGSVTTPTGYTLVVTATSGTSPTSARTALFRRSAVAGDAQVTLTYDGTYPKAATVAIYRGVNPTSPIDATSTASASATTTVTAPAVTPTVAGDQLVFLAGAGNAASAGMWTAPASMTQRVAQAGGSSVADAVADRSLVSSAVTGASTATFTVTAELTGVLVALAPAQTTFAYDSRGNRIAVNPPAGPSVTFTYDQANRLTADGTTATYSYNGDGLRMAKTVSGTASASTWDVAEGLPLLLVDGSTDYVYGPGGLPLEQVSSSGTLYYHQDQLGSTRALTNASGSVVASYTYDAYGRLTASTGTASNPFRYAGQYTDAESGLIYLRARNYDPGTGQFMSRDPLVAMTGVAYGYVGSNPLNEADPLGLFGWGSIAHFVEKHKQVLAQAALVVGLVALTATGVGVVADGIAATTLAEGTSDVVLGGVLGDGSEASLTQWATGRALLSSGLAASDFGTTAAAVGGVGSIGSTALSGLATYGNCAEDRDSTNCRVGIATTFLSAGSSALGWALRGFGALANGLFGVALDALGLHDFGHGCSR